MALAGVNCSFPRGTNVAIFCPRDRDREALLAVLIGSEQPDKGRIIKQGRMSWPVGEIPSSRRGSTAAEALSFLSRVYGVDSRLMIEYVDEFAGLGKRMFDPLSHLDKARRQMVAFGAVLAIPFDWYLLTGGFKDSPGATLMRTALDARLSHSSAIIISDEVEMAMTHADVGIVLRDGRFELADSVQQAASIYLRS